ncbi:MAG: DUF5343 domain-containing protein [Sneathiellales bacterium]|nr:DUF5343 domain-containing protein [Sneathiellales bacterium]
MKNLPYAQQAGTLESMLEKIKTASVPEKFSHDFVSTKLAMKGGTARSTIPFIKKMGFATSDGTPTQRYSEFRNPEKSKFAIANAMREVYSTLFEMNEYVYELDNKKLKSLIVEATGAEINSTPVTKALATFNVLNKLADFEGKQEEEMSILNSISQDSDSKIPSPVYSNHNSAPNEPEGINLSYTINLNLPATTDVEVFNAIFKSLKQHLLQG